MGGGIVCYAVPVVTNVEIRCSHQCKAVHQLINQGGGGHSLFLYIDIRCSHQCITDRNFLSLVPFPIKHFLKVFTSCGKNEPVGFYVGPVDVEGDVTVATLLQQSEQKMMSH